MNRIMRRTLFAVALAVAGALPAYATDAAIPPSGVPGIGEAQLTPGFWIGTLARPDDVILDSTAIAALNERIVRLDPSMHDIRHLSPTLPRATVSGWIAKLTKRPDKPLFDSVGKPVTASAIDDILANAALDHIPETTTPRYGMAVRRTALRGYPTDLRVFSHPDDTDIDRFQESALFPGDPLVIVHTSRDGLWHFVVSPRYAAWVHAADIATGTSTDVFAHADATPYRIVTGAKPRTVYTPDMPALSELQLDMGTRVPLDTKAPADQPVNGQSPYTSWVLSLPVRGADGSLSFHSALLQRNEDSAPDYLPLTRANIVRQAFRFLGERYGWGHAFNGRDCSGFVSDVYRSMGVQMPRNTGDQSISPGLDHTVYTDKDSHAVRSKAIAALDVGDLVYIPGHVMMVIGRINGEPYVIHDVGGIAYRQADGTMRGITLNEVAVTPLLPLMFNDTQSFVDRMTSIVRIRPTAH